MYNTYFRTFKVTINHLSIVLTTVVNGECQNQDITAISATGAYTYVCILIFLRDFYLCNKNEENKYLYFRKRRKTQKCIRL